MAEIVQLPQLEEPFLRNLLHLQSTEVVQARVDNKITNGQDATLDQQTLGRCYQRDTIMASRPVDCWCLGLGYDSRRQYGRFCQCPEGRRAYLTYVNDRATEENKRRRDMWDKTPIPSRFKHLRLSLSPLLETHRDLVFRLCHPSHWYPITEGSTTDDTGDHWDEPAWGEHHDQWYKSWLLWGDYGVGKTGLAVGYARQANLYASDDYGNPPRILFCTMPDLLAELRATYNHQPVTDEDKTSEEQLIQDYGTVPFLILDDIGAEQVKNQEWVADRLYRIIGKRHGDELPTLFTSNLSVEELGAKLGERIMWRIIEMCGSENIVEIKGVNLRE